MPQPREYLLVLRRVAGLYRVRYPVQGHPCEHAWQAQAVISVEMRDADPGDPACRDPGEQHLPLCPLARVEQQSLVIPQQQVAVVVAAAGRRLARRPEHHQLPAGHNYRPYARRQLAPNRPPGPRPCRLTPCVVAQSPPPHLSPSAQSAAAIRSITFMQRRPTLPNSGRRAEHMVMP
jgi:hypothetical protein